ncbi:MAG TPA: hypothetical protein VH186_14615 [Chloroflexia bacterium]|nr:hypothetical protein [Chloroflexia bacterium]
MQVRTLHFSDFLKLGRMHQADIGLNLPYSLVIPDVPIPAALTQHLPVSIANTSVYICEDDGKPSAFAQARARQRRAEWEILCLGVVGNVQPEVIEIPRREEVEAEVQPEHEAGHEVRRSNEGQMTAEGHTMTAHAVEVGARQEAFDGGTNTTDEEISENFDRITAWPEEIELAWLKLLEHLVIDAGEKGIVRVYARLSSDSPQLDLFNQTGFHAYTHENLFHLQLAESVDAPVNLNLKEQRNRDAWFIQQLYSAITPTFVQNSEQTTSRSWEIHKGYLPRPTKETGWLLKEADKAVAYIRLLSHRNRHLLQIMNLDTRREILPDLVRFALSNIKAGPDTHVYCAVREYQAEQEAVLEDAGFVKIFGKQSVLVKHTVQYVRATERQLVRGREGKLELARTAVLPDLTTRLVKFIRRHLISLVTL